jgi:hypothetical protein
MRLLWVICLSAVACGSDDLNAEPFRVDTKTPQDTTSDAGGDGSSGDGLNSMSALKKPVIPPGCPIDAPTSCPDEMPHYSDVQPIFATHCLACHDGMHGQWTLGDYEHIADWFGEIRAQMISCTMPPVDSGLSMPLEDRMTILNWIRCGFPK